MIIINQGNNELNLFNKDPLITVTKAQYKREIMNLNLIEISFESEYPIPFHIGDFIMHRGNKFNLNDMPKVTKVNNSQYLYDLTFESVQYNLLKKIYFNLDAQGNQTAADEPITGTIETFLNVLINNANMLQDGNIWHLGVYPSNTEAKTLTFNDENCLSVLQRICQEYEQEFELIENQNNITLNIKKLGSVLPYSVSYGKGEGLNELTREKVSSTNVVTKMYVYGSSENLPSNYRNYSKKLRMPSSYGSDFIMDPIKVNLYGLIEGIENFDDIKPTFTGVISAVGPITNNRAEFSSNSMDFDLFAKNAQGESLYLVSGSSAKVSIKKGNLAGYEFEVFDYNHTTKTFKLKLFQDEKENKFPNTSSPIFQFAVGDEFTLLDLLMPQSYVDVAENKLKTKALEKYDEVSKVNVQYGLKIDRFFLELIGAPNTTFFNIGDTLNIKDVPLNIDKSSRIITITQDLLQDYVFDIGIADSYDINFVAQIINQINTTQVVVTQQGIKNALGILNGYRRIDELKDLVFDTDGYFDPVNIKPLSIETSMLSVGAKSQRFVLENIIFTPNYNGNINEFDITFGKLVHFSISDNIVEWNLLATHQTLLDSDPYYIYAKCLRSGNTGTFEITKSKIKFDSDLTYYYFLIGILHSPQNGSRYITMMEGATTISGRYITSGRIQSLDGNTYFDLDSGEISGNITFDITSPGYNQVLNSLAGGGRNILRHSNFVSPVNYFSPWAYGINANINFWNGILEFQATEDNSNNCGIGIAVSGIDWSVLKNNTLTISYAVKTTPGAGGKIINPQIFSYQGFQTIRTETKVLSESWQRVSVTFKLNNVNYTDFYFYAFCSQGWDDGQVLYIKEPKLEIGSVSTEWSPAPEDIQENLNTANTNATNALNAANSAQTSANNANALLADIANDNKLTPVEKQQVKTEWDQIQSEKPIIISQAVNYSISTIVYETYYQNLNSYLTNNGLLNDLTTTSDIVGTDFRNYFKDYYTAKVNLLKEISDKAKQIADAANAAAQNAQTTAQNAQNGVNNINVSLADIKTKTDNFLSIQGGLLMGNILSVGDNQLNQNAFLSGITDAGGNSIRIGAGANYANKNNAPFRVLDNGKMIAQNADISGTINATSGSIAGWNITTDSLTSQTGKIIFGTVDQNGNLTDGLMISQDNYPSSPTYQNSFLISSYKPGQNLNNIAASISASGAFNNSALELSAKNSSVGSAGLNALYISSGNIFLDNNFDSTGVTPNFKLYRSDNGNITSGRTATINVNGNILRFERGLLVN